MVISLALSAADLHIDMPIADPVLIFALAMIIFVSMPLLFERIRVPGIIGVIVAGAVVGPNGLNLLERGATVVLLGTVGLLYLMFMVGLELDLVDFNRYRNRSVVFGLLSFVVPQVIGTGAGLALGYSLPASLLTGAVFASHTVLAYPIASRLGIVKNLAVTTTLGGTILTEILALLVLAIIAGSVGGEIGLGFWATLLVSLAVYVGAVLLGVPRLGRWFFRRVRGESSYEYLFVMAVLFSVAWLAHLAGVEPIIGALLAGLAFNRLVPEKGTLMNRINFVGNAFFIPFFLLSVGMLVDVGALDSVRAWTVALVFAVGVALAKWLASWLNRRVYGYTPEEGWVVFGLSVPHASGTLAIVLVGFDIGLFGQTEVNGIVLTLLVTSLLGPWLVERYGRAVALLEEQKAYEPSEAPQRILIPLSNPATVDNLMDLAMMLHGEDSEEPLYPLMVARGSQGAEAEVAEAEKMLGHAVLYASGAEVPVLPVTRVDPNIASGIVRAITETRTSMVVVGWDGGRSRRGGIFGSVLDQLLEQTRQMVVVAKLGHPLNTTKRLLVVVPPLIQRHTGFADAVRTTKVLGAQLGASIVGLVVGADTERIERLFAAVKPEVPSTFVRIDDWGQLLGKMRDRVRPDDLVIALSARRGTLPWTPQLEQLPGQLSRLLPESFVLLYPPQVEERRISAPVRGALPGALEPERIVFDLPPMHYRDAIRKLLEGALGHDPDSVDTVTDTLVRSQQGLSTQVRPGVVVPHARIRGLRRSLVFLGTSPEGIRFPSTPDPAHLIFLLLSPGERPEEHLRALAEISRLVSRDENVEELLGRGAARGEPALPDT